MYISFWCSIWNKLSDISSRLTELTWGSLIKLRPPLTGLVRWAGSRDSSIMLGKMVKKILYHRISPIHSPGTTSIYDSSPFPDERHRNSMSPLFGLKIVTGGYMQISRYLMEVTYIFFEEIIKIIFYDINKTHCYISMYELSCFTITF